MKKTLILSLLISHFAYSQTWTNLLTGAGTTFSDYVLALAADSTTNELYIGGTFNTVSGFPYTNLVKWNGSNYINIGADGSVTALAAFNGKMYAGGGYSVIGGVAANRVGQFNGSSWQPLGAGVNAPVYAFAWYNGLLYAGGSFSGINGFSTSANHIATWNGSAWAPVGSGSSNGTTASGCCLSGDVNALCVYNNILFAGGEFSQAGNVSASSIAKWNGTSWGALGSGINGYVTSFAVYNGELYIGGNFLTAGGINAHYIARWNGTIWAAVGAPASLNNPVWSMEVINGELYVAGSFSGVLSSNISKFVSKWNGTSWKNVTSGSGTDNVVFAIAGVPAGWIYAGGGFFSADGNGNNIHISRLFDGTPLPLDFISFTATSEKDLIHLEWKAAPCAINISFEVLRSEDKVDFKKISLLDGEGNAHSLSTYYYDDKQVQNNVHYYYRIKQIDINGEEKFSQIISAEISGNKPIEFSIAGNPLQQAAIFSYHLPYSSTIEISINDITGKNIFILDNKMETIGEHALMIDKDFLKLSKGIYFVTLTTPAQVLTKKLVVE